MKKTLFFILLMFFCVYLQAKNDSNVVYRHRFEIGLPWHNFFDNRGFMFTDRNLGNGVGRRNPIYLGYNYQTKWLVLGITYHNFTQWYGKEYFSDPSSAGTDPPPGYLVARNFSLARLTGLFRWPFLSKRFIKLSANLGLGVSYRFEGLDDIYLYRKNPIEVETDAIFYNRIGETAIVGLEVGIIKHILFNCMFSMSYFNEPEVDYPQKDITNYSPNHWMAILKFGFSYEFNLPKSIKFLKKEKNN